MKFKIDNFLIAAMSVLILIASCLSIYFLANTDRRDVIEVELEGDRESVITFDAFSIFPGDDVTYTVSIGHKETDDGNVIVNFSEDGKGALNDYLYVRISTGGETVYDKSLTELIDKGDFDLGVSVSSKQKIDLEITYYLPLEVGNEAQGASSGFMLTIKASNG